MKKMTFVSMVKKKKPLDQTLIQNKVIMIYTLETANSTLNVDWPCLQNGQYTIGGTNGALYGM